MTRAQRHRIYKRARRDIAKHNNAFGCHAIEHETHLLFKAHPFNIYDFPEFVAFKGGSMLKEVWFYTKAERLAAFDICIEQTKCEWRNPLKALIENLMNQIL